VHGPRTPPNSWRAAALLPGVRGYSVIFVVE
jgi:hypothetical protein